MKVFSFLLAASAALSIPGIVSAQAPISAATGPKLTVGATIYDTQGGEVGKIDSMSADAVVVDTGAYKATLPKTAFGSGEKGPTLTVTKAQIDEHVAAATQKANEALEAALVVGAEVKGKAGTPIGTVKEVTGARVVIDRASGPVALNKQAIAVGPQGLYIALTAEELDSAAKPVSPTTPASPEQ